MESKVSKKKKISSKVKSSAAVPLYKQLEMAIESDIQKGKWIQGQKINSESELGEKYQVSRITVRAALDELVQRGLLVRIQGKGTFVSKLTEKMHLSIGAASFAEICREANVKDGRKELLKTRDNATAEEASQLGLSEGAEIIRISRLFSGNGMPLMVTRDVILPEFDYLLELDFGKSQLNASMLSGGTIKEIRSAKRFVELCMCTFEECEMLGLVPGSSGILLRDIATDENGRPIRLTTNVINGERVAIEFDSPDYRRIS